MSGPLCPLCGSADIATYQQGDEPSLDASSFGSSRLTVSPGTILRCRECGFGFRRTRASKGELRAVYREMDSAVYQAELRGRRRTAKRHLAIVSTYASHGRLLDVGCGSGAFLILAADSGWDVVGLEPSRELFEKASEAVGDRGHVLSKTLEEADLPESAFDAITMWDVLEHVSDPIGALERCRSLLKHGGYLFVNVPDLDSLPARIFGRRWPLLLPEHLNYFTRSSLNRSAIKAGLSCVGFGRRPAYFSLNYVFDRLAQHGVPGAAPIRSATRNRFGAMLVPVWLGETYGVWTR